MSEERLRVGRGLADGRAEYLCRTRGTERLSRKDGTLPKVRLTAEQVLIAHLRAIVTECRVIVHVRNGAPTRIACEGQEVPRVTCVDIEIDGFEAALADAERGLLRLAKEVQYGEIPVVVRDGAIVDLPAGAMTWTRLTEPVDL